MARPVSQRNAQAARDRILALGGHGVWEPDMVTVSLANTPVTDDDLKLFRDFPHVRTLNLSHTGVGDAGLAHLAELPALEELIVVGTRISQPAVMMFRRDHPSVRVRSDPLPEGVANPFTGKPL